MKISSLITLLKFLGLVIILNISRYIVGGPIESVTIMKRMHRVMPEYPDCFNVFTNADMAVSFFYNFVMWLSATWIFFVAWPAVRGSWMVKSFKIYGLVCFFFISLAAVYMNHYAEPLREFYLFSMMDAIIVFSVVAITNGLIFSIIFKREIMERQNLNTASIDE